MLTAQESFRQFFDKAVATPEFIDQTTSEGCYVAGWNAAIEEAESYYRARGDFSTAHKLHRFKKGGQGGES